MGKKFLAVLLAAAMTGSLLAGCGGKTNDNKSEDSQSDSKQETSEKKEESTEKEEKGDPVSLRFVMYGEAGARDSEFFKGEFHDRLLEELNLDISVDYVPWGSEDTIATMIASGEKFAFYAGATQSMIGTWVNSGYFATIDEEMIEEVAPHYLENRPDDDFASSRFNGDILLLPVGNNVYGSMYDNLQVRNDILNEVGWDVSQIETYDDLMEAFSAVHEAFPDLVIIQEAQKFVRFLDDEIGDGAIFDESNPCTLVAFNLLDEDSDEVINWLESEYFEKMCKIAEDWYAKGFTKTEHLTNPSEMSAQGTAGNVLANFGSTSVIYKHQSTQVDKDLGADWRYLKLDDNPVFVSKSYDWAWAFSSAAQDLVEDYLRFFEWMYSSQENYLYACYGVEGQDWHWNEDGEVEQDVTDSFFGGWMHKSYNYEPISEIKYDAAEVEEYLNYDNGAIQSKKTGFCFDNTSVATEEALLLAITTEKVKPIAYGMGNYDEDFPAILQELKDAGLDKYVEEYQRQFSEFMANK